MWARLGRKTRIGGKQRETLWSIFERVRAELARRKVVTWSDVFGRVTDHLGGGAKGLSISPLSMGRRMSALPSCASRPRSDHLDPMGFSWPAISGSGSF